MRTGDLDKGVDARGQGLHGDDEGAGVAGWAADGVVAVAEAEVGCFDGGGVGVCGGGWGGGEGGDWGERD